MQIDVFINGLRAPIKISLRRAMLTGSPFLTLSAAITAAQNEESLLNDTDVTILNKKLTKVSVSKVDVIDDDKSNKKKSSFSTKVTAESFIDEILVELKPALKDMVKEVMKEEQAKNYSRKNSISRVITSRVQIQITQMRFVTVAMRKATLSLIVQS